VFLTSRDVLARLDYVSGKFMMSQAAVTEEHRALFRESKESWPEIISGFVDGFLESVPSGELLFELRSCKLKLQQNGNSFVLTVSRGWERVGEGGVCPKQVSCGAFGSVESGEFTPRQK
jgi:hypothetical protein